MKDQELLTKLMHWGVTVGQLERCLMLRKGMYPLPLYVKDTNKKYHLTNNPQKEDVIEGILLPGHGVILFQTLDIRDFAEEKIITAGKLTKAAHRIHEKARLLESDDFVGSDGTTLSEVIDENSPLSETLRMLKSNLPNLQFQPELAVKDSRNHAATSGLVFTGGCLLESAPVSLKLLDDYKVYIIIPEDKLDCPTDDRLPRGLDCGYGVDGCHINIPDTYPLLLLIKDAKGEYRVRKEANDGETVEGIVAREVIILKEMIYPSQMGLQTLGELKAEAKKIHPNAIPLYFEDFFFGNGISNLLLIDREKYIQTAALLSRQGINMPDITGDLHYWALKMQDDTDRLPFIRYGWWRGQSTISFIKQMLVCIPRNSVDPSCYDRS